MCETDAGLCSSHPCNTYDKQAACEESATGYTCQCSDDQHFGLNCEADARRCDHQEESYCICSVNNMPVKFPIPTPVPHDGVGMRYVIAGIVGILLGWLVGSACFALYHFCCAGGRGCCAGSEGRSNRKPKPAERPTTASSALTTSTGYTSGSRPGSLSQVQPQLSVGSEVPRSPQTTNIYRAGFTDDMSHMVSNRKSPSTYMSSA